MTSIFLVWVASHSCRLYVDNFLYWFQCGAALPVEWREVRDVIDGGYNYENMTFNTEIWRGGGSVQ